MASLVKVIQLNLQMKPYSIKESGRCTEEDKMNDTSWLMEIFATVEALFHTTDMQQKRLEVCSCLASMNYLFLYVHKGNDCITVEATDQGNFLNFDELSSTGIAGMSVQLKLRGN